MEDSCGGESVVGGRRRRMTPVALIAIMKTTLTLMKKWLANNFPRAPNEHTLGFSSRGRREEEEAAERPKA